MQRTHVSKRLTALLLTLVMLLGIIPTAWANPEGPQPMEIHGWGLQEQDHELIAQQQDLHFEFQGIPTEGYAFLASEFSLTLEYYGWIPRLAKMSTCTPRRCPPSRWSRSATNSM